MKRAEACDEKLVVDILSQAFDDNKSVNYVVRQGKGRQQRIKDLMRYSFKVCMESGQVWISDDKQGCALILCPERKPTTLSTIWADIRLAFSVIGLGRVSKVMAREAMIKAFHPDTPMYHMWFIGVLPEAQGNGIGSGLIRDVLSMCDRQLRPIYLETSVESNLNWYKNFGFEIINSIELTYKLYILRRSI